MCVRESGKSREEHSTHANNFSCFSSLDLVITCSSSLTQLAIALAATKVSRFTKAAGRIRSKSRLTCGGLVMANERESRVAVVHGCFPEGSDSILSAKRLLLGAFASEAARQLVSFSG